MSKPLSDPHPSAFCGRTEPADARLLLGRGLAGDAAGDIYTGVETLIGVDIGALAADDFLF